MRLLCIPWLSESGVQFLPLDLDCTIGKGNGNSRSSVLKAECDEEISGFPTEVSE